MAVPRAAGKRIPSSSHAAEGPPDLAITAILVLHHVQHRERSKKLSEICFTLNDEDTHVVSHALKKRVNLGLLSSGKQGKEVFYAMTPAGRDPLVRALSGRYDLAARAAASL